MLSIDAAGWLRSPILAALPWLEHGFGTRQAGPLPETLATVKQVHSRVVLTADRCGATGEGDGLLTNIQGVGVSVRTADCYPVLLADSRLKVVAAVHAGWRGTAACIVSHSVERMREQFGTRPEDVYAAIGPGIGQCCYQVGEDVGRRFGLDGAGRIDLAEANWRQLVGSGVPTSQIDVMAQCTFCNAAQFHSYRREGEQAGRMISYIRVLSVPENTSGAEPVRGPRPM